MESNAKYALVGIVVLALIGLIIGAVLWITDTSGLNTYDRYTINFKSQSLIGLQVNSNVTMKGIKVGSVESLQVSPKNIEQVTVQIKIADNTPVKIDTRAVIERNLLTGLATIELSGSSQESERLTSVLAGELYPVIPEGRSKIDAVAASIPDVVNNVNTITAQLSGFLSPENERAFSGTLQNINTITSAVAAEEGNIRGLVQDLKALSGDLREASRSISNFTKTGDETLEEVRSNLNRSLEKVQSILGKMEQISNEVSGAVTGSSRLLTQQFEVMSQSLQETSKRLSTAADNLTDVRGAVFGPDKETLGPGEKLP